MKYEQMRQNIYRFAMHYRSLHPYSAKELEDMVLFCQKNPNSPKWEEYIVNLYWYYITDIFASIRWTTIPQTSYYSEEDVAAEAIASLFQAIRTYRLGEASFRTFVSHIAKHTAGKYVLENSSSFRISKGIASRKARCRRFYNDYIAKNGTAPTRETIIQQLGLTEREFNFCFSDPSSTLKRLNLTDIDDITDAETSFEEECETRIVKEQLSEAIREELKACLTPEEEQLICLRNGIGSAYHSVQETAKLLQIPEEEILPRELEIWEKLRSSSRMQELAASLQDI